MPERAEIEAVAAAISGFDSMIDSDAAAEAAIEALDRFRDARGDDEAKTRRPRVPAPSGRPGSLTPPVARSPRAEDYEAGVVWALRRAVAALGAAAVAFRKLDAGTGYPPHIAAGDAKRAEDHAREALRRYDREREAARSPQGEDHEAAVSHWECQCGQRVEWKLGAWFCPTHRDRAVVHPVAAPSRDGTVAVDDARAKTIAEVVAWLREPPTYNALRLAANAIEREFGSARAGESNEGGNQ